MGYANHGEIRKKHYSTFYSADTEPEQKVFRFFVDYTMQKSLVALQAVNERICYLRLKATFQNISLIPIYAWINFLHGNMGKHSPHNTSNDNDLRTCSFAASHNI